MKIKYENAETTSNRKGQDCYSIWQYEVTNVYTYFGIHLWIWFKGRRNASNALDPRMWRSVKNALFQRRGYLWWLSQGLGVQFYSTLNHY